jgi:HD-GYP domain-containing protein (c-di-GMP phosphodiesterase class II)
MSETQALLGKITALRQRLQQAQGLVSEAGSAMASLMEETAPAKGRLNALARQVAAGGKHDVEVDTALRPLPGLPHPAPPVLPRQLTARARRVVERGRELLGQLRSLDIFADVESSGDVSTTSPIDRDHPLARLYRETLAIADTSVRMMPRMPDTASAQLHVCEGLEAILNVVADRLRVVNAGVERQTHETGRVTSLANLLIALEAGRAADVQRFVEMAEAVVAEAQECGPLRFLEGASDPARFIASHSLNVAQVMARVVRHDADLRSRQMECVLAALVHDVGMLRVPADLLTRPDKLDDEQRRLVEAHCRAGATLLAPLLPDATWLTEAACSHHERGDGTGYPDGLREFQIKPLTRMLAVCDVYASLCAVRPYRPARETRTALADTLLLAEQGLLDRHHAECLLHLSFYPVGSVVELADGAVGVVVATPGPRRDLNSPARPVVALLTDSEGAALALPSHLDLAQCDNHSIVRTLSSAERREVLGSRFPEWV